MDLTPYLMNAQNADPNVRAQAQDGLTRAEAENLPVYLVSLVTELGNDSKPAEARQMAGLLLKNTMTSKDEEKKRRLEQQWTALPAETKVLVRQAVLSTLESNTKEARQTAAQVLSQIASIELPLNQWTDLVPTLLQFVQSAKNDAQKEATLTALGYLCEESDAELLQKQSNEILTAVVQGLRKEEANNDIRFAAAKALMNSLEFVRGNMENETERNYLMGQVCEATQAADPRVREAALQCLVKVVTLYYDKLKPYMQALFNVTMEAVKKDEEKVGLQGIEFWSTMCEVELEQIAEESPCERYVKGAAGHLCELLTSCLTRQNADQSDEWNLATAAGTALCLVAQTVEDDVVQHVMPFIATNISNADWKYREAATLAFGAILDGPSTAVLGSLVDQAVPTMISQMSDSKALVKDTTAWTLGRIADLHAEVIVPKYLQPVLHAMVTALADQPNVAAKAAWCIQNLCNHWEEEDEPRLTYPLSALFTDLIQVLLKTIDRADAGDDNLRAAAYEALNALLTSAPLDCLEAIKALVPNLLQRLEATFGAPGVSGALRQEQSTIQGLLCGSLQVVTRKLGKQGIPFADSLMQMFLKVFAGCPSSVHEECLMAVGAVANVMEKDFVKYMQPFAHFLLVGLKSYQEYQVCNIAVGVVNDLAAALGTALVPYCDDIMTTLLENLRALELNRDVKPVILACFGDIALNIGGQFEKYLPVVMSVMDQAGKTKVPEHDQEMLEYLNVLRENICEAYTGILQGLKAEKPEIFLPFVPQVLEFIHAVAQDQNMDEPVCRACVGVIGDLANVFGKQAATLVGNPYITQMVAGATQSSDEQTQEAGRWAMTQLQKVAQ